MARRKKLILYPRNKPDTGNVNIKIQYFGSCLGLFGLRDKDSSCFRIFIELVKTAKTEHPISSQELAYKLNLTRGTVVHHLNKLMDAGIVRSSENRYFLRDVSLAKVLESVDKEIQSLFKDLKHVAKELDIQLNLKKG